ncbi:TlpA family protein disulfide reductase [Bacillus sp. DJP31]|uniref:TlpA family protein disulfide reductase n=1 Tax=Bacillus sp. DJP31 TaxID=3409789 RepID=UPI003BB4FD3F
MKRIIAISILLGLIGYTIYTQVWVKTTQETANVVQSSQTTNPFNPNEKLGTAIQKGPLLNKQAPDFTLETLDGKDVTLSELKGKKVFINFWASWCPPCLKEMPEIQAFSDQNPDIIVLAVDFRNTEKSDEAVQEYITENKYTFPVLLDRTGSVGNAYKVLTLPTSYFVNTKGVIQYKYIGPLTIENLEELVNTLE